MHYNIEVILGNRFWRQSPHFWCQSLCRTVITLNMRGHWYYQSGSEELIINFIMKGLPTQSPISTMMNHHFTRNNMITPMPDNASPVWLPFLQNEQVDADHF